MTDFLREDWTSTFISALNAHDEWTQAARYFSGKVGFKSDKCTAIIDVKDGQAVLAPHAPTDILITGPEAEWANVVAGKKDFFHATAEQAGALRIEGNAVHAMQHCKMLWLALDIMAEVGANAAGAATPSASPSPSETVVDIRGQYITVDGVRTYVEQAGAGQVIICFHAACQDTLMYRYVLAALSDRFTVIAVDAPGHGKSCIPSAGLFESLSEHAIFNEKLINALGVEKPVIVGCSMAGNLVLEMASRRPQAYAAVISAQGADYTPTLSDFVLDMLLLNGAQILEGYGKSLTGSRTPPERAAEIIWQLRRATPQVMRSDLKGYAGFDIRNEVFKIAAPVLLIRGQEDWLVSQQQVEDTASRIPDSEITLLQGTGHYPMLENPVEFNDAVREFLHRALR